MPILKWLRPLSLAGFCLVIAACTIPEVPPPEQPAAESAVVQEETRTTLPSVGMSAGFPEPAEPRTVESVPLEGRLPFSQRGWDTDFTKSIIDLAEIRSGGPPKDGIPSIDAPSFESIEHAADWLTDTDPVIVYEVDGVAKAYPLAVLIWHEIVNDEIAGRPVTVTFCPLCNASVVFDRRVGDMVLDFGTTGNLRNSDLVMYDRTTETWWQQFTGKAIVGELTSTQLNFLPSQVLPFAEFRRFFPDGTVLQRPLDLFSRQYGSNPYVFYDTYGSNLSRGGNLVLFSGVDDDRLEPLDRVVGVLFPDQTSVAIPFETADRVGVVSYESESTGIGIVVFHQQGMSSALDASVIGEGRDIGSVGVFFSEIDDQTLTFEEAGDGVFRDTQTGSEWNIRGRAVSGELAGKALQPAVAFDHFWFAWAAFLPDTQLLQVSE